MTARNRRRFCIRTRGIEAGVVQGIAMRGMGKISHSHHHHRSTHDHATEDILMRTIAQVLGTTVRILARRPEIHTSFSPPMRTSTSREVQIGTNHRPFSHSTLTRIRAQAWGTTARIQVYSRAQASSSLRIQISTKGVRKAVTTSTVGSRYIPTHINPPVLGTTA
jgi:hypothetical protein